MEAPGKNKRGLEGGDEHFFALNEFNGLAEKSRKSIHGVRFLLMACDPHHAPPRRGDVTAWILGSPLRRFAPASP